VPQLEPRSFSFNSPFGACETCTGLGSKWSFDPVKVIADPSRPLLDGGIAVSGNSSYLTHAVNAAALKIKANVSKPFDTLPQKAQNVLLDAVLGVLDKLYNHENATDAWREWYMQYMTPAPCPACHGKRLKPSSLAVRIHDVSISALTEMSLSKALDVVRNWTLTGREKLIGGRAVEEIRNRLEFLLAVGLEYLSLERSSASLSGGEAQRIRLATQIGSKLRGVLYVLGFAGAAARPGQYSAGSGA
jgi:excinuclease ABC subunit A